ncbi:cell wall-binding repeat-containing protein [Kineococcus sp. SYSU DK001]|uniref:cell wall-binding repeat-containing protein n=1 Tax=Kineococcus sp. SYSU DK001 TaxID=3383122 RepID=UPI003D7EE04A
MPRLRALTAVSILSAIALAVPVPTAGASTGFQPDAPDRRIGGVDRFDTAARTALDAFPAGTGTALLANGWRNIDALSGAYLAGLEQAPILLTERDAVPAATLDALRRLGVRDVIVLGDENSVGDAALDQLEAAGIGIAGIVAGEDRYDTAAQVYGFGETAPETVFIARGDVPAGAVAADALAAGPAAFNGRPILLTAADRLPDVVADALDEGRPRYVVFLGRGITQDVKEEVADLVPGAQVQTIGGADRTETAALLARAYAPGVLYEWRGQVAIANGYTVDALGAGVWAGLRRAPILLTAGDSLGAGTTEYLTSGIGMTRGTVFGDVRSVPQALAVQARELAHGGPVAPSAVTAVDRAAGTLHIGGATADLRAGDTYAVDDTVVTRAQLLAAAHVGSRIVVEGYLPKEGTTTWTLLTTRPEDWTDGTVQRSAGGFALVEPHTDVVLRSFTDAALPAGATFGVDGAAVPAAAFLADLDDYDTLRVDGDRFALTNREADVTVTSVSSSSYRGAAGLHLPEHDHPLPTAADVVEVDGVRATPEQFRAQLTVRDRVLSGTAGGVHRVQLWNGVRPTFYAHYDSGTLPTAGAPTAVFHGRDPDTGAALEWAMGWGCAVTVNGVAASPEAFAAALAPGALLRVTATDAPLGTAGAIDVWRP